MTIVKNYIALKKKGEQNYTVVAERETLFFKEKKSTEDLPVYMNCLISFSDYRIKNFDFLNEISNSKEIEALIIFEFLNKMSVKNESLEAYHFPSVELLKEDGFFFVTSKDLPSTMKGEVKFLKDNVIDLMNLKKSEFSYSLNHLNIKI